MIDGHNALQRRHNERDGVSKHQRHDCLLKRLFRRRSKKTSKLRVTGLCEFPTQRASNAEFFFPFADVIRNHSNSRQWQSGIVGRWCIQSYSKLWELKYISISLVAIVQKDSIVFLRTYRCVAIDNSFYEVCEMKLICSYICIYNCISRTFSYRSNTNFCGNTEHKLLFKLD